MLGYNKMTGYNVARYNADGFEMQKADVVTIVDGTLTRSLQKPVFDLVVVEDTSLAKEQNKSVTETLRLDAWLRVKREDSSKWED